MQNTTLEIRALEKRYGTQCVVSSVSFTAARGEIIGLLGPNGAGKTTTVSMIAGLTVPTSGEVLICGAPSSEASKRRIGLVPQDLALFDELSARLNLETFGALYGLRGATLQAAITRVLALVGLSDRADDTVAKYSGGMKRRLNLACALLHDPDVLLLDEPTVGIDPQSRNAIFDNLEALRDAGKTIVYTTHYMEEVERLCDRIVIMDRGAIVALDTIDGLRQRLPAQQRITLIIEGSIAPTTLSVIAGVTEVVLEDGTLRISAASLAESLPAVFATLTAAGVRVLAVHSERASLETVFLQLTGRQLRDEAL